jgi:hypothetical protein
LRNQHRDAAILGTAGLRGTVAHGVFFAVTFRHQTIWGDAKIYQLCHYIVGPILRKLQVAGRVAGVIRVTTDGEMGTGYAFRMAVML